MKMDMEENQTNLLDLLVVVAENLKLLILGPVVFGLLAWGAAYTLPHRFTSQAILTLPTTTTTTTNAPTSASTPTSAQAAAMMVSPLVLDPFIKSLDLSNGRPIQVVRAEFASQIKAAVGKDGLLRLDVTAGTPLEAQALANAIIDNWLKSTIPREQDRLDLETRLAYAKTSLESVRRLLDRLTAGGVDYLGKPLTRGEAGTSIVAVGELQVRYLNEVLSIPRSLRGLSRDVVVQPPTLPTEPIPSQKSLIAVLAALVGGVVLLLWVFMRQAWNNSAQDPQVATKQAKLFAALGFKVG